MKKARIEIEKTETNDYRISLIANDGETLMEGYLTYYTMKQAKRAALRIKRLMASAEIKED